MDLGLIADALRDAEPVEFWVAMLVALGVLGAGFRLWLVELHRARLIEDTPTSRIRSASQGYVELEGIGRPLPGEPVRAPLSGLPCTWWSFRIEKRAQGADRRDHGRSRWYTVEGEASDSIFALEDSTGQCVVDPEGAKVYPSAREVWYGSTPRPSGGVRSRGWFGIGKNYRYTESRMMPGDPLFAIGSFRTHARALSEGFDDEVRLLLAGWKRDRPELLRRFDANRDGEVDLREWELAREAAREQVLAERRRDAALPGLHLLSRPDDERPYLLAALTQQRLIGRHRRRAIAGLLLFIAGAAATAFVALARFGVV